MVAFVCLISVLFRFKKKCGLVLRLKNINNNQSFPTSKDFREMNRGDLLAVINSLGGFNFFRKKLGFGISKQGRKIKTYSLDEVVKQLSGIIDEIG